MPQFLGRLGQQHPNVRDHHPGGRHVDARAQRAVGPAQRRRHPPAGRRPRTRDRAAVRRGPAAARRQEPPAGDARTRSAGRPRRRTPPAAADGLALRRVLSDRAVLPLPDTFGADYVLLGQWSSRKRSRPRSSKSAKKRSPFAPIKRFRGRDMLPRTKEHLKTLEFKADPNASSISKQIRSPEQAFVQWFRLGQTPVAAFDDLAVRVVSENIPIPAGETVTHKFLLYHGPVKTMLLGQRREGGKRVAPAIGRLYTRTNSISTRSPIIPADTWISKNIFWHIGWTYLLIQCTKLMHILALLPSLFVFSGRLGHQHHFVDVVVRGAISPSVASKPNEPKDVVRWRRKSRNCKRSTKATSSPGPGHDGALPQAQRQPGQRLHAAFLQMPIFMGLYYCLQESMQFRLAPFLMDRDFAAPDRAYLVRANRPPGSAIRTISAHALFGSVF